MAFENLKTTLEKNGYTVSVFATGKEAANYLAGEVKGTTVGLGGSMTLKEMGVEELLKENNTVYWHWNPSADPKESLRQAMNTDVYLLSANAIAEDTGEILNIDGRGNRLAAQVYGDKRLYIVAGVNKICPDFSSALDRARNQAAPPNCERLNRNTPCRVDGKCHDCHSADRICNALLVHWAPMMGMDTEVVLINEALGY